MNNPPDISQDPSEHEEYAHNVQKHVRGYLMVGALLLSFTAITVALSYVNFGTPKANIAVAMLVATLKAGLVAAIFMHLAAEKRLVARAKVSPSPTRHLTGATRKMTLVSRGSRTSNCAVVHARAAERQTRRT